MKTEQCWTNDVGLLLLGGHNPYGIEKKMKRSARTRKAAAV